MVGGECLVDGELEWEEVIGVKEPAGWGLER